MAARLSHRVVVIDTPMAPAVMRTKLLSPAAAGMRSGGSPESVMVVSGMKKNAMAAPWITVGISTVTKSVSVLKRERIHNTRANTMNAPVAMRRGSHWPTLRPTMGVSKMASTPTGASAIPAAVAV